MALPWRSMALPRTRARMMRCSKALGAKAKHNAEPFLGRPGEEMGAKHVRARNIYVCAAFAQPLRLREI